MYIDLNTKLLIDSFVARVAHEFENCFLIGFIHGNNLDFVFYFSFSIPYHLLLELDNFQL